MRTVTQAVLALTLLAGAAPDVQAQDSGRRGDWVRQGNPPRSEQTPRGEAAPAAHPERERERRGEGRRGADGAPWAGRSGTNTSAEPTRDAGDERRRDWSGHGGEHRDWGDHDGRRERDGGERPRIEDNRAEPDRRDRDRRRDHERRDDDRRWWDRGSDGRDWGRQARPRYDRRHYPPIYRPARRFHVPVYRPPIGFYSRSWVFGEVLPRGWYGPEYRLVDWWAYGLPVPPIGYEWVRVGDDALLVDEFTGRIVQVVRNLFW